MRFYGSDQRTVFGFSGTTGNDGFLISNAINTRLFNFGFKNGYVMFSATAGANMTGNVTKGITISQIISVHAAAFSVYYDSTSNIEGLKLGNIVVLDSHTDGLRFGGAEGNTMLKKLEMRLCQSENSGLSSPRSDLSVGYRFGAGVNMQSAAIYGCDADYSWGSGFYFAAGVVMTSITLTDCSSNYNGQKGDAANGIGYQLNGQPGIQLVNCGGLGNKGALIG